MITYQGRTQCLAAWAREIGVYRQTLHRRVVRGEPIDTIMRPVFWGNFTDAEIADIRLWRQQPRSVRGSYRAKALAMGRDTGMVWRIANHLAYKRVMNPGYNQRVGAI